MHFYFCLLDVTHEYVWTLHKHVLCHTTKATSIVVAILILFEKFKLANDTQLCLPLYKSVYHFAKH